jgi:pSer/pThr/pTyr-binding forkhead associated (FHA) protein
VITCPKCAKDNQDHYKFCLGCGAELPRDAAPKPFIPQTPPQAMRPTGGALGQGAPAPAPASLAQPAPQPRASAAAPPIASGGASGAPVAIPVPMGAGPVSAAPATSGAGGGALAAASGAPGPASAAVLCPQCGHVNTSANLFCGSCGFRLGGGASRSAAPAPVAGEAGGGVVLTALRADGSEAGTYRLPAGTVTVGRETGAIFGGDSYLSPRHATFRQPGPGQLSVKDEESLNGVYKKLARDVPVEIKPNDIFRIGQEIIRFEPLTPLPPAPDGVERLGAPSKGYVGRIALVIGRDATGNAFPVPEAGVQMGRERGDVLFPEDGYVSGLHCRLTYEGGVLSLTDLGSSNGSFVRVKDETVLQSGDVLLMGQQLFRIAF